MDQAARGPCWVFAPHGEPVAAGGLVADGDGRFGAWFIANAQARRHLAGLVRFARFTLVRGTYPEVVAEVTTREGARLATLIGFRREGRFWVWRHECDVRRRGILETGAGPATAAGGSGTAAAACRAGDAAGRD